MKVVKIYLSLFLVVTFLSTIIFSSYNVEASSIKNNEDSTNISIGGYTYQVEIKWDNIIVEEYSGDKLISTTTTSISTDKITRIDNSGNRDTINRSSIIQIDNYDKNNKIDSISQKSKATNWKTYGKYKISITKSGKKKYHYALLKYYVTGIDNVSYTINAKKGQAVSYILTGLVAGLSFIIPASGGAVTVATVAKSVLSSILSGFGVNVVSGIITKSFSDTVSSKATYYKTKYTTTSGSGPNGNYKGTRYKVLTKKSKYYDKTYYDGHAPQRYKVNTYTAWNNTYVGTYNYGGFVSFKKS